MPNLFLSDDGTQLRTPLMIVKFVYTVDTTTGDKIKLGTYSPPAGTDEYTKLCLKYLKRPSHVSDFTIPNFFSTADYRNRWKPHR